MILSIMNNTNDPCFFNHVNLINTRACIDIKSDSWPLWELTHVFYIVTIFLFSLCVCVITFQNETNICWSNYSFSSFACIGTFPALCHTFSTDIHYWHSFLFFTEMMFSYIICCINFWCVKIATSTFLKSLASIFNKGTLFLSYLIFMIWQ